MTDKPAHPEEPETTPAGEPAAADSGNQRTDWGEQRTDWGEQQAPPTHGSHGAAGEADQADNGEDSEREPSESAWSAEDRMSPAPRRRRLTAASAMVALLLALLGFTFVVQIRSVATDPTLAAARQDDLVRILADLDAHEERLRQDIAELDDVRSRLTTAGESQPEALAEAARRADELGILAGTLPAAGPGLRMVIRAGQEPVTAPLLLDAVQELRAAGAEAIQVTDAAGGQVRVIGSTYFLDYERGILIDGEVLQSPFTLTMIGQPETLRLAMTIPGGVVERVHGADGTVTMHEEPGGVEVTVVREPAPLRYARPVS